MDRHQENLHPQPYRPSFFGLPASFFLWARVGAPYWGGLLAGLGLGLLVARILEESGVPRMGWLVLLATVLIGIGQGIAIRAVRRRPAG